MELVPASPALLKVSLALALLLLEMIGSPSDLHLLTSMRQLRTGSFQLWMAVLAAVFVLTPTPVFAVRSRFSGLWMPVFAAACVLAVISIRTFFCVHMICDRGMLCHRNLLSAVAIMCHNSIRCHHGIVCLHRSTGTERAIHGMIHGIRTSRFVEFTGWWGLGLLAKLLIERLEIAFGIVELTRVVVVKDGEHDAAESPGKGRGAEGLCKNLRNVTRGISEGATT
mmetsp:Transcript_73394/g.123630  ORF Transcript_73394/g.123630 Transcript_73394/m.123630 type:complete len:225 (-) Transcript_73394:799-1473(-)